MGDKLRLLSIVILALVFCSGAFAQPLKPEERQGSGTATFVAAKGESLTSGKSFQIAAKQGLWYANISAEDQQGVPNYVDVNFAPQGINEQLVGGWRWAFRAPPGQPLKIGQYKNAVHALLISPGGPGIPEMSVDGRGRGCDTVNGSFIVTAISWDCIPAEVFGFPPRLHLTKFVVRFEQFCDGTNTPKLQGTLTFTAPKKNSCTDSGGTDPDDGGGGESSAGESLQVSLPVEYLVEPAVVANATTTTLPVQTTTDGTFESDVTLIATTDAQDYEDFRVELTKSTIASPGIGDTELRILTGPSTFPRTYQVTITAIAGDRITTTSMLVTVTCDPPTILGIDQPKSISAANGSQVTLQVKPTGSGPFFYQWYKGVPGMTRQPVLAANESKLIFTTRETATYWVRVSNACGTADSNGATVSTSGSLAGPARRRGGKS